MKTILITATISGALAVMIGAFGAHGLKSLLTNNQTLDVFDKASKYHFYHTFALLFCGLWIYISKSPDTSQIQYAAYSFLIGITIFSGSLYTLAITNIKILGAITPLGGLGFIIGWVFLFLSFLKL